MRLSRLTSCRVFRMLALLGPIAGSWVEVWAGNDELKAAAEMAFFESKIRPIFIENCFECHSAEADKPKGGLRLDRKSGWEKGGDSGPALVPGDPEASLLVTAISQSDPDLSMPPKYRLKDTEIEALRRWVKMGAPDPRDGEASSSEREGIDLKKGGEFWAFRPFQQRPLPEVDGGWAWSDIDHFVWAGLKRAGVDPAGDTGKRILVRRAYFDLIGLPPTLEEVQAFLDDETPEAFAKVVDGLLDRPEFGERWGRHWLDVTRFAESSGGGRSLMFPHAWRFRDYVIDAFNRDKPFNRLIREHLAGDLLPWDNDDQRNEQLVGSGYLLLGAINYELQDKELLRMEVIDEQVSAMGRTFLGMTLDCARCHDHKFDPIPTTDYYALAGIFGSTESLTPGNVSGYTMQRLHEELPEEVAMSQAHLKELDERLKQIRARLKEAQKGSKPLLVDNSEASVVGRWTKSTAVKKWIGSEYIHDEGQEKGANRVTFAAKVPASGTYQVSVSYTASQNRSPKVPVSVTSAHGTVTAHINQRKAPSEGGFQPVGTHSFEVGTDVTVEISNEGTEGVVIVDAVQFVLVNDAILSAKKELEDLMRRVDRAKKDKPEYDEPVAMAVKDAENPADGHVHIRGGVRNTGALVPRGFLTAVMREKTHSINGIGEKESGRLQLAEWIASPNNPLTARVAVNRIWKYLLGEGIVRTTDNFGQTGERPGNPELLDYLANRFVGNGWSTKAMIREIMGSHVYQLSSEADDTRSDPENRLFGRFHRKRLEAEAIRDSMLVLSGSLDPARGGRTIRKLAQFDLGYEFDTQRRSVYVPWFRNSMLDLFETFDVANPNLVVGRRTVTNLPTQALYLMNSPFVQEQARKTAEKLVAEGVTIDQAYETILGRLPSSKEREASLAFLSDSGSSVDSWAQVCHSLFGSIDFRYLK